MCSPPVFYWKLLQDPLCAGVCRSLPQTFWEEPRAGPTFHLAQYYRFPQMRTGGSCGEAVLVTQHLLSTLYSTAGFRASPCPGPEVDAFAQALQSATQRQGRERAEGLPSLPPSELVHPVKHRSPAVTVDHVQSRGRVWNSSEISPTAAASQAWASPSPRPTGCCRSPSGSRQLWSCLSQAPHLFLEAKRDGGWRNISETERTKRERKRTPSEKDP